MFPLNVVEGFAVTLNIDIVVCHDVLQMTLLWFGTKPTWLRY